MTDKINTAVDKILDMNPDPIPKFVLLKEFKKLPPDDREFRGLYAEVCNHSHIKSYENAQNERGFWPPFHGYTEAAIRKLLSFGLDSEHICLKNVSEYLVKVLNNQEEWNQYEKQDNPLWYTKMFVPLVSAAMLSLIDSSNPALEAPRKQWAYIAKKSFESGYYDPNKNIGAISDCFAFTTKRPIPPFNYYCLLLLSPDKASSYIDDETDKASRPTWLRFPCRTGIRGTSGIGSGRFPSFQDSTAGRRTRTSTVNGYCLRLTRTVFGNSRRNLISPFQIPGGAKTK